MALTLTRANVSADWEEGAIIKNMPVGSNALNIGEAVYVDGSGNLQKADANGASEAVARAIGVIVAATDQYGETTVAANSRASVCVHGIVRGWTGMTPGGQVYVGTTPGALTQTAPTPNAYQFAIGYALEANALFINPESDAAASV